MDEVQESNAIFHELWGMYARGAGGEVAELPGITATWAGVAWPIVNVLFLSSPIGDLEDLRSRLQRVGKQTEAKQQPGMLIACDAWLPAGDDVAKVFPEYGWIQISQAHGMVCENVADTSLIEGLEFRRVEGPLLRRAAADLNGAGYEVSPEMAREALDHENLWGEGCFGYVGYFEGTAVTTSTTYVRDGYLYVALVATLPEFRSRGFGAAITSHSIKAASAASGLRRTILHATPAARHIYESLGFRTVTTFPMFLPAALLGGPAAH
jgi:ribosomal protein S18 acetylase RimI-like enzyme